MKWKKRESVADVKVGDEKIGDDDNVDDTVVTRSAPRTVEQKDIDKALQMKERGETVHAGLRTFTSTALRPIRYLGEKASTIAKVSGEEKEKDRPIMDTVGGLGNAMARYL